MQIINSIRIFILLILPLSLFSQSSYIPTGFKEYDLIDRLEIKTGNTNLMYSNVKPFNRRLFTREVETIDSTTAAGNTYNLTETDKHNMKRFLMSNSEWSKPKDTYLQKNPFLKYFFKTKGNFYEVNDKDFSLIVNPVVQYQQMFEKSNGQNLFLNSRGFSIRGIVGKKVGFDLYVTDNQERDPLYVQNYIASRNGVPGARFYKNFKAAGGVDYFDARGSISFNASKYIDIQLGYDRNFIGDGYRSLFLSDFSANALFLKFNTRIWKFNYENLFMELLPDGDRVTGSKVLPRKYFRMNYLSLNATKWLNIGVFDAVMFGRKDRFDFQYLIPVMFLRPAESDIGSGDNALVGLNVKANIKKKVQLYGQLVVDEFLLREVFKSNGYWANKYGYQLGVKYPDAFGIKNLDIQIENNRVRPFTYTHNDSSFAATNVVSNFSHANNALAHPLGAGFQENIFIVKYQPLKQLFLTARAIYYKQGLDTAIGQVGSDSMSNFGTDIFRNYRNRPLGNFGYFIGSGNLAKSLNVSLLASYELMDNMFVDAGIQYRSFNLAKGGNSNTTVISIGFRWNMARRMFDF